MKQDNKLNLKLIKELVEEFILKVLTANVLMAIIFYMMSIYSNIGDYYCSIFAYAAFICSEIVILILSVILLIFLVSKLFCKK